jgi:AcrR family transcriptional regulator
MNSHYLSSGRTRQKTATRKRILNQALALMKTGRAFTLEDVVKTSGLSRATVYRYFSNIDVLVLEAGLDPKTLDPDTLFNKVSELDTQGRILKIQQYFNELSLNNEDAFRKYLGTVLIQPRSTVKRGGRRVKTMRIALKDAPQELDEETIENLVYTCTILMGIEPVIAARDVCGLSKDKTKKTLQWALQIILNQVLSSK